MVPITGTLFFVSVKKGLHDNALSIKAEFGLNALLIGRRIPITRKLYCNKIYSNFEDFLSS